MHEVLEQVAKLGVVPVVVLNDVKDAAPLAKALCEGGLPCAEVTFRTEAAEESIRIMSEQFPEMLVGAGTVLTIDQVDRAVAAGAKFIVSPGFDPEIVDYCLSKDILVLPGCITPSEVAQAVKRGLKIVKFFVLSDAQSDWIKSTMLTRLQEEFKQIAGSSKLGIEVDVLPQEEQKPVVYLEKDKAKRMMVENPEVALLVQDLGLDA